MANLINALSSESKKNDVSSIKQINPIVMMTDAIIQGSMLAPSPSKRKESKYNILDSCLPWLEDEQGVSDFFMAL